MESRGSAPKGQQRITELLEKHTIIADVADQKLGFTPKGKPPERVFVKKVQAGGWSSINGIHVGDELLEVQGQETKSMATEELERHMTSVRPLRLTFASTSKASAMLLQAAWRGFMTRRKISGHDSLRKQAAAAASALPFEKVAAQLSSPPRHSSLQRQNSQGGTRQVSLKSKQKTKNLQVTLESPTKRANSKQALRGESVGLYRSEGKESEASASPPPDNRSAGVSSDEISRRETVKVVRRTQRGKQDFLRARSTEAIGCESVNESPDETTTKDDAKACSAPDNQSANASQLRHSTIKTRAQSDDTPKNADKASLSRGDQVRIVAGRAKGNVATVLNPDWHGLAKVFMSDVPITNARRDFQRSELEIIQDGRSTKEQQLRKVRADYAELKIEHLKIERLAFQRERIRDFMRMVPSEDVLREVWHEWVQEFLHSRWRKAEAARQTSDDSLADMQRLMEEAMHRARRLQEKLEQSEEAQQTIREEATRLESQLQQKQELQQKPEHPEELASHASQDPSQPQAETTRSSKAKLEIEAKLAEAHSEFLGKAQAAISGQRSMLHVSRQELMRMTQDFTRRLHHVNAKMTKLASENALLRKITGKPLSEAGNGTSLSGPAESHNQKRRFELADKFLGIVRDSESALCLKSGSLDVAMNQEKGRRLVPLWSCLHSIALRKPIVSEDEIIMQGRLEKRGPMLEYDWTSLWCVLSAEGLQCFSDRSAKEKKAEVKMTTAMRILPFRAADAPGDAPTHFKEKEFGFVVECDEPDLKKGKRLFYFDAGDEESLQAWIKSLERVASDMKNTTKTLVTVQTELDRWGREAKSRLELHTMKQSALLKRAAEAGATNEEMDTAVDEEDPSTALIELILEKQTESPRMQAEQAIETSTASSM